MTNEKSKKPETRNQMKKLNLKKIQQGFDKQKKFCMSFRVEYAKVETDLEKAKKAWLKKNQVTELPAQKIKPINGSKPKATRRDYHRIPTEQQA